MTTFTTNPTNIADGDRIAAVVALGGAAGLAGTRRRRC
jgi:hypothetical protein